MPVAVFVFLGFSVFFAALFADHWGENENTFLSRLTKRPSEFQVRSPATLVASGFVACNLWFVFCWLLLTSLFFPFCRFRLVSFFT
jgi:hypothetical protein